jgi:hypothetical protein
MYFDKTLARRSEADVVLISRENFILFTPMLHEVAAGDLQPTDIVIHCGGFSVTSRLSKPRSMPSICTVEKFRAWEGGFDHLLLTLGAETNFFDIARARMGGDDDDPRGRRPAPQHDGCNGGDGAPRERISSPPVADVRHCWRRLCRRRDDVRRQRFCL